MPNEPKEDVLISHIRLEELHTIERTLNALYAMGVKKWEGFENAMDNLKGE